LPPQRAMPGSEPAPGPCGPNRLRTVLRLCARLQAFVLVSFVLPILLLAGYGLFAVLRDGYLWQALAVSAAACVLAGLALLWRQRTHAAPAMHTPDPALFETRDMPAYWTPFDRDTCVRMMPQLHAALAQSPGWKTLPEHGLALARRVALHYHQDHDHAHWAVTPLELLAVTEHLSRRYRHWLQEYVPGVERLHVAQWMWLDTHVGHLRPWFKLYRVYRKVRLLSPEGLLAEVRSRFLDKMFENVSTDVQVRLKTVLLRDAVYAAIDLYGGHYRHVDAPLEPSAAMTRDTPYLAAAPEPVRICLIGQTGAGKSSIVNALLGSLRAEVSPLPSTDHKQVYDCTRNGENIVRLIDLPGLTPQTAPELLEDIKQCDLVLWALQADQAARALDVDLRAQLRQWAAHTPQRQPPVLLGVLTQVDRLARPGSHDDPQGLVDEALAYTRELMALDGMLALSLAKGVHAGSETPASANAFPDSLAHAFARLFPITGLQDALQQHYEAALNVQLNRRRLQADAFSATREFKRALHVGKTLFQQT